MTSGTYKFQKGQNCSGETKKKRMKKKPLANERGSSARRGKKGAQKKKFTKGPEFDRVVKETERSSLVGRPKKPKKTTNGDKESGHETCVLWQARVLWERDREHGVGISSIVGEKKNVSWNG